MSRVVLDPSVLVAAIRSRRGASSERIALEARAKRASRRKFEAVLVKIPDVEPDASDRIPAATRRTRRKKSG